MLIETNKIKKNKIRVRLEPKSKVELVATTSAGASIKLENRFPLHHLLPVATPLHTVKKSSIKMIFFLHPIWKARPLLQKPMFVSVLPSLISSLLRYSCVCENVCTFWALSYTLASVRMASVWAAILLSGALQGEEGKTEGKISNSISISGQDCVCRQHQLLHQTEMMNRRCCCCCGGTRGDCRMKNRRFETCV